MIFKLEKVLIDNPDFSVNDILALIIKAISCKTQAYFIIE
jgi:hypothetical protein